VIYAYDIKIANIYWGINLHKFFFNYIRTKAL